MYILHWNRFPAWTIFFGMYQIGNEEDSREKKKIGGRIFLLPKLNETEVSVHYL